MSSYVIFWKVDDVIYKQPLRLCQIRIFVTLFYGNIAMGASLGNWEFLSQTNDNADCVPIEDRFKFVDDLSTLEVINLLTIGLSSFYMKQQVPSDIPVHGQYISADKLKSQTYLNLINEWTEKQKWLFQKRRPRQ